MLIVGGGVSRVSKSKHINALTYLYVKIVRLCTSLSRYHWAYRLRWHQVKANAFLRRTKDRDGSEEEIELIK